MVTLKYDVALRGRVDAFPSRGWSTPGVLTNLAEQDDSGTRFELFVMANEFDGVTRTKRNMQADLNGWEAGDPEVLGWAGPVEVARF